MQPQERGEWLWHRVADLPPDLKEKMVHNSAQAGEDIFNPALTDQDYPWGFSRMPSIETILQEVADRRRENNKRKMPGDVGRGNTAQLRQGGSDGSNAAELRHGVLDRCKSAKRREGSIDQHGGDASIGNDEDGVTTVTTILEDDVVALVANIRNAAAKSSEREQLGVGGERVDDVEGGSCKMDEDRNGAIAGELDERGRAVDSTRHSEELERDWKRRKIATGGREDGSGMETAAQNKHKREILSDSAGCEGESSRSTNQDRQGSVKEDEVDNGNMLSYGSLKYRLEDSRAFHSPYCEIAMSDALGAAAALNGLSGSLITPPVQTQAVEHLREAVQKQIDTAWAQEALKHGVQYAKEGDFPKARHCYLRALELDPTCANAHVAMGAAHANEHSFQEASHHFQQALSINPHCSNAQKYLDVVKEKMAASGKEVAGKLQKVGKEARRQLQGGGKEQGGGQAVAPAAEAHEQPGAAAGSISVPAAAGAITSADVERAMKVLRKEKRKHKSKSKQKKKQLKKRRRDSSSSD